MKRSHVGQCLFAVSAAVAMLAMPTGHAAVSSCGLSGIDQVFTGEIGRGLKGAYIQLPFDVGAGATKLRVKLCTDQAESAAPSQGNLKHTLDLGLYQPTSDGFYDSQEFRGWGGSSRLDAFVSPEAATLGFIPGAVISGTWVAEVGVAAIVDNTEGDLDGKVAYRLEVAITEDPADADSPWQPTSYNPTPASSEERWYKGDFHVHAEHSNPSDATMAQAFQYAFSDPASGGAGLDFVTLSDYVTTRHWDEIGRFQPSYPNKLIIRSAEVITYRGHVNNHASVSWADYRTGPIYIKNAGELQLVRAATPPSNIFDQIHSKGGWSQINHPTTFPSKVPVFDKMCRGCSWEYSDTATDWSKVDAMEVQTGPAGLTDPKGHEPGPNPFSPAAIEWWDRLRREGFRITAVGSSDSHKANAESVTTSPIGEATTAVFAEGLSESSIRAAILAGHAYVKFFGANGPDLRFTARPSAGGAEVMMGDRLSASVGQFTASVLGAAPSPEARTLVVMKDGLPLFTFPVVDNDSTFTFTASLSGDYRLQLMRASAIEALTNPITLKNSKVFVTGS